MRHMTSDKSMFSCLTCKDNGYVTYADNGNDKIICEGDIAMYFSKFIMSYLLMD